MCGTNKCTTLTTAQYRVISNDLTIKVLTSTNIFQELPQFNE